MARNQQQQQQNKPPEVIAPPASEGGCGDIADSLPSIEGQENAMPPDFEDYEPLTRREELQLELAALDQEISALNRRKAQINAELDGILELEPVEASPEQTTAHIQAYIKSQAEERARRAQRVERLAQIGLDQSDLSVKAPVDRHQRRRTVIPLM